MLTALDRASDTRPVADIVFVGAAEIARHLVREEALAGLSRRFTKWIDRTSAGQPVTCSGRFIGLSVRPKTEARQADDYPKKEFSF